MHQETISTHFKNIKRKSAIEAKEKISNLNSNKLTTKEDNSQKPQKIIFDSESESNANPSKIFVGNFNENPIKRKSLRNQKAETFQIPESLTTNKKINLEDKINKKRKREEEEIIPEIQSSKKKLLNTKNKRAIKQAKEELNGPELNSFNMEVDHGFENNYGKLKKKNEILEKNNLGNCGINDISIKENKNAIFAKNDLSDKTKELIKKIMGNKNKKKALLGNNDYDEEKSYDIELEKIRLHKGNLYRNSNVKPNNAQNTSSDKNYISDDVLDSFAENLKKKNNKNLRSKINNNYSIEYTEEVTKRNRINKKINNNNIGIVNINDNSNNSISNSNTSEILNYSNNNNNNNRNKEAWKELNFNKLNHNFSFENENSSIKNTNNNVEKNLHLSSEVKSGMNKSSSEFKIPVLSVETKKILNEILQNKDKEERENNFNRTQNKLVERDRSQSSFSLKFKYEELVKQERELLLPPSFKKLYLSFEKLDSTLNFFKMSKSIKIPFFTEIQSSIENTHKE